MNIFDFIDECQKANPIAKVTFFIDGYALHIQWRWKIKDKVYGQELVEMIPHLRDSNYPSLYLQSRLQEAAYNMSRCGCDEENNQLR